MRGVDALSNDDAAGLNKAIGMVRCRYRYAPVCRFYVWRKDDRLRFEIVSLHALIRILIAGIENVAA